MSYADICEVNKLLFGALESFTNQINACRSSNLVEVMADDIKELTLKKERVRDRLNYNLELLDNYWMVTDKNYRIANNIISVKRATPIEELIIESYVNNPDRPQYKIAIELDIDLHMVSRVISNYLAKMYIMSA